MADVSVRMGVSGISQFKQGMSEAANSVKTLDAMLAANEKAFKKSGDAESHYAAQTTLLNQKLEQQRRIVKNAEQALQQMEKNGIDQNSKSYQNMLRQMVQAQSGIMDTETALENLGAKAEDTSGKTDQLASSLGGLNKKVSLDQVISAVGKVTDGLERAGQKAVRLGKAIWDELMESARWADDSATMAMMYGVDLDTFLRVQKLVQNGMDTSVEAILKSQSKLKKGVGSESKEVTEALQKLGISVKEWGKVAGESGQSLISRDSVDLFWEAGQALMSLGDEYEQEALAQTLFGKSWRELVPLFKEFANQEEYKKGLEGVTVNTEEEVSALAELNDKIGELKGNFDTLENKMLAGLAPAMTKASEAISGLLDKLITYLETPEGQQALDDMAKAVEGLFSDISNIDPEEVVKGFADVFNEIVEGLQWLSTNSGTVIGAMQGILAGWGALKLTGGALEIYKLISGIRGLGGAGAAGEAAAAGAAAGNAWSGGFAAAVMKAAPWLVGLYTLLNPAGTAKNDQDMLYDPDTHKLTKAGEEAGITMEYDEFMNWKQLMNPKFSAEGQADWVWENQVKNGNAWVEMTEDQINAVQKFYDVFRENGMDFTDADWDAYEGAFDGAEDVFNRIDELFDHFTQTHEGQLPEDLPEDFFKIAAEPVVADGAAESIAEQVGPVEIPVNLVLSGNNPFGPRISLADLLGHHANGLPMVPFDGYMAMLHKGERVVPAREVAASRNFSSNLYVESMVMNNGQDAEGLAAAIAAANRRTMQGFGS